MCVKDLSVIMQCLWSSTAESVRQRVRRRARQRAQTRERRRLNDPQRERKAERWYEYDCESVVQCDECYHSEEKNTVIARETKASPLSPVKEFEWTMSSFLCQS